MTIRTALKDLSDHYIDALERGDTKACGAIFADNALFLFHGGSVQGRKDIITRHKRFIRAGLKIVSIETIEFKDFGDLGYAVQSYATTNKRGHMLLVVRRQEDESWKIQVQSADMPPITDHSG